MIRNIIKNIVDTLISLECSFVRREVHEKKRVLLFRKDVLGDFVLFLPTLPYYREFYKEYEISLVVSAVAQDLSPLFPFIDDVIIFDQKKFRTSFWYRRAFIKHLAHKGFDVAIYPVYSHEKIGNLIMKATRAPSVLDFKTINVEDDLNELDRNMSFVSKVVGKECTAQFPTIDTSLLHKNNFEIISSEYGLESKKYMVMVPGSSATYKMWQLNKMSEIADYCCTKGYTVVLCGAKDERALGEEIIGRAHHRETIINLIGDTKIPTLVHLVAHAAFYFGNDTGTLHLAAAVGTPAIAIMGGGHFGRFFPYGNLDTNRIVFDKHMTCKGDGWKCAEHVRKGEPAPCIRTIEVLDAKKEIDDLLTAIS